MKKFALVILFLLNFSMVSAFAQERIIVDKIAKSEAEEIELKIPKETKPGPGKVTIEIINDDNSVAGTAYADFCKDLDGFIHWNEPCEDIDEIATLNELNAIADRDKLPSYDPAQEPQKTSKNMLAGLAALALIGTKKEEKEEKEELEFFKGGDLGEIDDDAKWGDLSGSWDQPFTFEIEERLNLLAERTSKHAPLFARKIADGSYLRAMVGSLATVLYPIALILGIFAITSVHFQSVPPKWYLVAAILFISTLDGLAGLLVAVMFFLATLLTGHITQRSEFMTVVGMGILFVAPPMIASAVRQLRRVQYRDQNWERLTDYALITLLTGWTVKGIIGSLNTLGHTQYAISFYAANIGFIVAGAVFIRMLLEDLAVRAFPVRLKETTPKKLEQTLLSQRVSKAFRIYIFFIIASEYVGLNFKLVLGTAIFFMPSIIDMIGSRFEKKIKYLYWLTPKGSFKTIAMIFIGGFFAMWMESLFTSPRAFLAWSFALLTIPSFIFQLFGLFGAKPDEDWKDSRRGPLIYRIGGIVIYILLVLMVKGVDLFASFKSLIGM